MISPYSRRFGLPPAAGVSKLAPNLYNKNNYIVHIRSLQFYLQQGLVLRKVHKVLAFNQSKWMAGFVDFNSRMRAQASNAADKDFFKLILNR